MIIPGYEDETVIARGGSATVYRARQRAFQRDVAIKVLDLSLSEARDRRRVQRECAAMGRLTGHPHIVWVLDSGFTDDGRPYLTTPFYRRGSLSQRLARRGPLGVGEVLHIGVAIAGALETAHRHGILHRDVKPGNILVSPYGEPALSDFGIASLAHTDGGDQSQSNQAFTIEHAAPETFDGNTGSVAADVYALSSTLWTLLAGRPPFAPEEDEGLAHTIYRLQREEVPPIGREEVPTSLETLLAGGMSKASGDRPVTAGALGQGLQAVQTELGLPVTPLRIAGDEEPTDDGASPARLLATAAGRPAGAGGDRPNGSTAAPDAGTDEEADPTTAASPAPVASPAAPDVDDPTTAGAWPTGGADDEDDEDVTAAVATAPLDGASVKPAPWRGRLGSSEPLPPAGRGPAPGPAGRTARQVLVSPDDDDRTRVGPGTAPAPGGPPAPARDGSRPPSGHGASASPPGTEPDATAVVTGTHVASLPPPPPTDATVTGPAPGPGPTGPDPAGPGFRGLPGPPNRPVLVVVIAAIVAVLVILVAMIISRQRQDVETVGDLDGGTTIVSGSPGPPGPPGPTAPPSTSAPAPTTTAPPPESTAPPTTDAPAPAVPDAGGGTGDPAIDQAASVAQAAGTALADARWDDARALVEGLSGDDGSMRANWGGLEAVTMVVVDSRVNGSAVTLRLGEIAHEQVSSQRRTSLYCVSWTVSGGRVVDMGPSLQHLSPHPWRAGWVPPAEAVPVVQRDCSRL